MTRPKITGLCRGGHHAACTGKMHRLSGGGPCACPCHDQQAKATTWTAQRVKDELPDVPVEIGGKVLIGRVRGRQLDFAGVFVPGQAAAIQYAWGTIAGALNKGCPLEA